MEESTYTKTRKIKNFFTYDREEAAKLYPLIKENIINLAQLVETFEKFLVKEGELIETQEEMVLIYNFLNNSFDKYKEYRNILFLKNKFGKIETNSNNKNESEDDQADPFEEEPKGLKDSYSQEEKEKDEKIIKPIFEKITSKLKNISKFDKKKLSIFKSKLKNFEKKHPDYYELVENLNKIIIEEGNFKESLESIGRVIEFIKFEYKNLISKFKKGDNQDPEVEKGFARFKELLINLKNVVKTKKNLDRVTDAYAKVISKLKNKNDIKEFLEEKVGIKSKNINYSNSKSNQIKNEYFIIEKVVSSYKIYSLLDKLLKSSNVFSSNKIKSTLAMINIGLRLSKDFKLGVIQDEIDSFFFKHGFYQVGEFKKDTNSK